MIIRSEKSSKWSDAAILFFGNLVIGLLFVNEGMFHYDSVVLAQAVEKTYQTGILQPAVQGRYGSVIVCLVTYFPFFLLGQDADFAIRFTSILFHALSIITFYVFILKLFNDRVQAFFGGLLLSFMPVYFSTDTYGKEHGMSVFFLLLSFCLLQSGLKRKSSFYVGSACLSYLFSVSIRESVLLVIPLFILLFLHPLITVHPLRVVVPELSFKKRMLFRLLIPFFCVLGLLWFSYMGKAIFGQMFVTANTSSVTFQGLFSGMLAQAEANLMLSVPGIFFVLVIIGVWRMWKLGEFLWAIFFLLWIMTILGFGNVSSYCPRYLDQVAIPLCVFAAYSLAGMYVKYKAGAHMIALYCALGMFLFLYPMLVFRHSYNGEKQLALFIKAVTERDAVIMTIDDAPFIEYYGRRKTLFIPTSNAGMMDNYIDEVKGYLSKKTPVYFTEAEYLRGMDLPGIIRAKGLRLSLIGSVLSEDYHRPEMNFCFRDQKIYKVSLK